MRLFLLLADTSKVDPNSVGVPTVKDPNSVINGILTAVYTWAGIICVLIIIIAGYLYVTSAGDPSQTKRAKNAILSACVGVVVVMMAFVITQFVIGRL
jgi:Ni,Fe-hydrogenase I cytochrome b subunit